MRGESIVCLAKDWDDDPTSNTHVMRELARGNRVLWLNSIGMRAPALTSGRDLRRIATRLAAAWAPPRRVARDLHLWVTSPLVLPPGAPRAVNRLLVQHAVRRATRRLGMERYQLWTFLPNVDDLIDGLEATLRVYYCVDHWAGSPDYDGAALAWREARLCAQVDVVLATSRLLVEDKRPLARAVHYAPHGVEHAHFARALAPDTPVAPEVAALRPPVLGVVGLADWRVDRELLAEVARRRPEWTIAIVGSAPAAPGPLGGLPNVHFLGRQPYARLPELMKGFAVGLVPFVVDEYTRRVNPVKLREYLAAGLPVVSTALPEVAAYAPWCAVAGDAAETVAAVERALDEEPALRRQRSAAVRGETWAVRVADIGRHIDAAVRARWSPLVAPGDEVPFVSVVVPVRNEEASLARCLDSVLAQSHPAARMEVVVVENRSTDRTPAIAAAYAQRDPRVRVLRSQAENHAAAMNDGVRAGRGTIVARIDGHSHVPPDYLARVVAAFARHPDAAAVGGPFLPEGESERERVAGRARSSRLGVGAGYGADRGERDHVVRSVQCGAYRRDVLLAAGLFDVAMGWGEDEELNWRLRRFGPIYLCPDLRQAYRPRATLRALARQYWNYGRGRVAVLLKHPDFLLPRHLAPSALVLVTLVLLVAATVSATAAAALAALLGAYGVLLGLAAVGERRAGWRERLLVPVALVCMHWAYGAGMVAAALGRARDAAARRFGRPLRRRVAA